MSLCKCFKKVEEKLKQQGLKLSDKCFVLSFTSGVIFGIPLQRFDHQKMKRSDPTMLFTARCPFCGKKFPKVKSTLEPAPAIRAAVEREGL